MFLASCRAGGLSQGPSRRCRGSNGASPAPPTHVIAALNPTALTSFSPSRNFSEVEWAAPAEGGVGGTLSQRHAVASRQARPAGMM